MITNPFHFCYKPFLRRWITFGSNPGFYCCSFSFVVVVVVVCTLQHIMSFCAMSLKNAVRKYQSFSIFLFRFLMEWFASTDSSTRLRQQLSIHASLPLIILFIAESFVCLFVLGATAPRWARASSFTRFLDHTQRRATVGRTPLYEWSARRRDLYLKTHNTHNRQTSMPPVGFEPTVSAGGRPQTYVDLAATGTGNYWQ